jgi:tripartite-type tricarboxylate transporter receptor subunit TctC
MVTRRQLLISTASLSPITTMAQAASDTWPNRPVKVLVGFPAGQGSDIAARFYADFLQKQLGQPFVVENKPGAGATIAAGLAAVAPPDGYTVLYTSGGPMAVAPHLYKLSFDPIKDLEPVAAVASSPLLLLVRPDYPAKTLLQLVAMSRQKELQGGSGGNGVTNHLALELFKSASQAAIAHIPYKGAVPAMADLMGGHIDMMFETVAASLAHVKVGRLRALAVTSLKRHPDLEDVPPLAESYPGFEVITWAMFAVPLGTPPTIVNRLNILLNESMKEDSARRHLRSMGIVATTGSTPASTRAYLAGEYKKWGEVIRKANISSD